LRWIKEYIILIGFLFISCEIVESELNNPLDTDANAEKGIAPPALVFFPDNVTTNTGGNAVVNVYALEVENVAGIVARVSYDNSKLNVSSVSPGSFFSDSQNPIFISEDNQGTLDIYSFYMGSDKVKSGTGPIAVIIFTTKVPGSSQLSIVQGSELLDENDVNIQIKGLGKGVVNAQ
tara:strand:+ start:1191 stop:1721 length:531 start_codon:yes stop_codon:yes gene_type:complete